MAQVIVDDIALREPNLLVPNKKPVGNVEIDWAQPITDGLIACWLFDQGDIGRDLCGNYHGINEDPANIKLKTGTGGRGAVNDVNNSAYKIDLGSITSADRLSGKITNRLSGYVFAHLIESAAQGNSYPRFIDKSTGGSGANGWAFYVDVSGDNLTFSINGTNKYTGTNTLDQFQDKDNGFGFSIADTNAENLFGLYINGVRYIDTTAAKVFNSNTAEAGLLNWNHTTDRQYRAPVYCIYIWDRYLSEQEHARLHADRYQILKPA